MQEREDQIVLDNKISNKTQGRKYQIILHNKIVKKMQ